MLHTTIQALLVTFAKRVGHDGYCLGSDGNHAQVVECLKLENARAIASDPSRGGAELLGPRKYQEALNEEYPQPPDIQSNEENHPEEKVVLSFQHRKEQSGEDSTYRS